MREACLGMAQSWLSLASDVSALQEPDAVRRVEIALDPPSLNSGPEGGGDGSGGVSDGSGGLNDGSGGLQDGDTRVWNSQAMNGAGDESESGLSYEPSRRED